MDFSYINIGIIAAIGVLFIGLSVVIIRIAFKCTYKLKNPGESITRAPYTVLLSKVRVHGN